MGDHDKMADRQARLARFRLSAFLREEGVDLLTVNLLHIEALERLEFCHKDPFDHLLVAQAAVEGLTILTADRDMTRYGVPCIGVR